MGKNNNNTNETASELWALLLLLLVMPPMPKADCTEVQVAELKGRVDTLEKIILKGE